MPSKKKQTAFRLDDWILDGLNYVKERDGVPLGEQVRRALKAWLETKGVTEKKPKKASRESRPGW